MNTYAAAVIRKENAGKLINAAKGIEKFNPEWKRSVSSDLHTTIAVDREGFQFMPKKDVTLTFTGKGKLLYAAHTGVIMLVAHVQETTEIMSMIKALDKSPMLRYPHVTMAACKPDDLLSDCNIDKLKKLASENKWDELQMILDDLYVRLDNHVESPNFIISTLKGFSVNASMHYESFNPSDLLNMREGQGIYTRMLVSEEFNFRSA